MSKKIDRLNIGFNKVITFKEIRKLKGYSVCDIATRLSVNYKSFIHQLRMKNPALLRELVKGYKSEKFPVTFFKRGSKEFKAAAKECTPINHISRVRQKTREEEGHDDG